MSLEVSKLVWKHTSHKGSEMLVLLAIANYTGDDGTGAWPSLETLAEDTRMSPRSVQYAIQELRASGELIVTPNAGPRGCNFYTIPLDHLIGSTRKDCVNSEEADDAKIASVNARSGEFLTQDLHFLTQPIAPDPSIDPSVKNLKAADAGARTRGFQPIPKNLSARRPQERPNSNPQPTPSAFPTSDGLADIHALQADPLLWQLAGTWVDLAGRALDTLTAADGEYLAGLRRELGDALTRQHIEQAKKLTSKAAAKSPTHYFEKLLREAAAGKLSDRPQRQHSNGNSPATPSSTDWQAFAARNTNNQPPPSRLRVSCLHPGCTSQAPPGLQLAKYCAKHGEGPTYQRPKEIYKAVADLKTATHR